MAAKPSSIPMKGRTNECFVCTANGPDAKLRVLSSSKGQDRGLTQLLCHIGVNAQSGRLCTPCITKLETIDRKVEHMKQLYNGKGRQRVVVATPQKQTCTQKSLYDGQGTKRCANSPMKSPSKAGAKNLGYTTPQTTPRKNNEVMPLPCSPAKSPTRYRPSRKKLFGSNTATGDLQTAGDDPFEETSVPIPGNLVIRPEFTVQPTTKKPVTMPKTSTLKSAEASIKSTQQLRAILPKPSTERTSTNSKGETVSATPARDILPKKPTVSTHTPAVGLHEYSKSKTLDLCSAEVAHIAGDIEKIGKLPSTTMEAIVQDVDKGMTLLGARTNGTISALQSYTNKSAAEMLESFSWETLAIEMSKRFPVLFKLILCAILPDGKRNNTTEIVKVFPKIGMVYGIIAQGRNICLSIVQRTMSMLMLDSGVPLQLFERFQKPGVCLCFDRTHKVLKMFKGEINAKIVEAVKAKHHIRIVGDNINFYVDVRDERKERHGRIMHYFGSAIIIKDLAFPDMETERPQLRNDEIKKELLLPSAEDCTSLIEDYAYLAMKVAANKFPFFSYLKTKLPSCLPDQHARQCKPKTVVIPIAVIPRNEQYYGDVVEILRSYVELLRDVFRKARPHDNLIPKIHIGGDQLTRARFSGAKRLMIGEHNHDEGFQIFSPITPEWFHMGMNFLQVPFKRLWHNDSAGEVGTMKQAQSSLRLKKVKPSVKDAYSADKDFFCSFVNSYLGELICTTFELNSVNDIPADVPAEPTYLWTKNKFKSMIQKNVGTFTFKKNGRNQQPVQAVQHQGPNPQLGHPIQPAVQPVQQQGPIRHPEQEAVQPVQQQNRVYEVTVGGQVFRIVVSYRPPPPPPLDPDTDHVFHYAQEVLEIGLLFQNFLEAVRTPNRERMLRTLKVMMVLLKGHNSLSKYSDEILRILLYQLAFLSESEAHFMFYSMFVNTKGRINTNIACDLQMEFIVKVAKKHLKRMHSRKNATNIPSYTETLSALSDVVDNYDTVSGVAPQSSHHTTPSKDKDEESMLNDLRTVRPFQIQNNRFHAHFPRVQPSLLGYLDYQWFREWLMRRTLNHTDNLGN